MQSKTYLQSDTSYLVNRVVSSPFFEKTYDTDLSVLNYLSKNRVIKHFDIFPIHQYTVFNRELFGNFALRGNASSYFEIINRKKNGK